MCVTRNGGLEERLTLTRLWQVTYGYTSATFSGRMPAVEIADAIVQTGRETLERVRPFGPCCYEHAG